ARQLCFEIRQILAVRINLLQLRNRIFSSFGVAFFKRRCRKPGKHHHVVLSHLQRRSIPFLSSLEMTGVEVGQPEQRDRTVIRGLYLICFQQELDRLVVAANLVVELCRFDLRVEVLRFIASFLERRGHLLTHCLRVASSAVLLRADRWMIWGIACDLAATCGSGILWLIELANMKPTMNPNRIPMIAKRIFSLVMIICCCFPPPTTSLHQFATGWSRPLQNPEEPASTRVASSRSLSCSLSPGTQRFRRAEALSRC